MDDYKAELAAQRGLRLAELIQALTLYDRAKARYQKRRLKLVADYPDRAGFLVGARQDLPYKEAQADCAWYSSEVQTLAAAVTALAAVTR